MDIDADKLISAVKKRSALYDTSNTDYRVRYIKTKLWLEVCEEIIPNWASLQSDEKTIYGKEVQKRWSSLRDCFRRELAQHSKIALGTKRKRKYIHFDSLLFLQPFTQFSETEPSLPTEQKEDTPTFEPVESQPRSTDSTERRLNSNEEILVVLKEGNSLLLNNATRESHNRIYDDDEAFLLSLLPTFRAFSEDQKYLLRIEIMQTILKFKQSQRNADIGTMYSSQTGRMEYFTEPSPDTAVRYSHHNSDSSTSWSQHRKEYPQRTSSPDHIKEEEHPQQDEISESELFTLG